MQRSNSRLFWSVLIWVTAVDVVTKQLAVRMRDQIPHNLVHGDWVQFTLVRNPGAAFGLNVGPHSRWVFMFLTLVALVILGRLYRATAAGDRMRTFALALVCGGAMGNLFDRVTSASGVIDFIDVGVGDSRWPTFNVADMAVSTGAFLLAWVLWGEESSDVTVAAAPAAAVGASATGAGTPPDIS